MHRAHNMKYTLFIFLLIPLFASAQIDTILSSNIQRTYKIQLPDNYDLKSGIPYCLFFMGTITKILVCRSIPDLISSPTNIALLHIRTD
jgi:hypothetical protein